MTSIAEVKNRISTQIQLLEFALTLHPESMDGAAAEFNARVDAGLLTPADFLHNKYGITQSIDIMKRALTLKLIDLKEIHFNYIGIRDEMIVMPPGVSPDDLIIVDPGFYVLSDDLPKKSPLHYFSIVDITAG